jgi:hypothetical protein
MSACRRLRKSAPWNWLLRALPAVWGRRGGDARSACVPLPTWCQGTSARVSSEPRVEATCTRSEGRRGGNLENQQQGLWQAGGTAACRMSSRRSGLQLGVGE